MIINDLVPGIKRKLRNRTDLDNSIPVYVMSAVLDLSENYPFEGLKVTGPITNFELNKAEYLKTNNPFINSTDVALTFIDSWFVWYTDTTPLVGADTGFEMKFRNLRVVEPMSKILGIPTFYTFEGQSIIVGFLPNTTYATQVRYQRQHPFPQLIGDETKDAALLRSAKLYLPKDWGEIVEYAAAAKAADDVGMPEIGDKYMQRLYGYKDKFGNETPGIIKARMSTQQRMGQFNEKQLRPNIRRFCR